MTTIDHLRLLREMQDELLKSLSGKDPLSEGFDTGVQTYTHLYWAMGAAKLAEQHNLLVSSDTTAAETPTAEEPLQSTPKSEPKSDPKSEPKAAPKHSREETRALLAQVQTEHPDVNLAEIFKGMGFTRFGQVPEDRYEELLELVDSAVKELS